MSENIKVAKCQEKEIQDVINIASEATKEGFIEEISPDRFREMLTKTDYYYIIVAKRNEKVAAFATSTYSRGKLHIHDIAVKKEMRRKGIGTTIVLHLIEHATMKKLDEVYCEVRAKNISSLKLFSKLGFKQRGLYLISGGFYGLYLTIK